MKLIQNKNSKHCGQCDRWVSGFDHHCKWLNNWVGEKNYKYFMSLICFFLVHNILITICWLLVIILPFTSVNLAQESHIKSYYSASTNSVFILSYVFTCLIFLFSWVMVFSTSHLILFHVYLKLHNLSTYKYIMIQRKRKTEMLKGKIEKSRQKDWKLECNQFVDIEVRNQLIMII